MTHGITWGLSRAAAAAVHRGRVASVRLVRRRDVMTMMTTTNHWRAWLFASDGHDRSHSQPCDVDGLTRGEYGRSASPRCFHSSCRSTKPSIPLQWEDDPNHKPTPSANADANDRSRNANDDTTVTTNNKNNNGGSSPNPVPDFDDAQATFRSKSTLELYRSALTYSICQIQPLVKHADVMLRTTRKILGDTLTDRLLKATLFGHFCAGTNRENIRPSIHSLEKHGIGSILDFAAEDDGESNASSGNQAAHQKTPATGQSATEARLASTDTIPHSLETRHNTKVRIYDYTSEAQCDQHLKDFCKCVSDVASLGKDGYAAIKITALGPPELLKRMSTAIVEAKNLFAKFDANGDGLITDREFEEGYRTYFDVDETTLRDIKRELRCDETNMIDYITWSMSISPRDLPRITGACREAGPLRMATPTEEEIELIERMYARGRTLAQEAANYGTRLLIDAEQVRFQPAIDNLVLDLQQTYNATDVSDVPLIYNTYQCYLKDSLDRLTLDLERSERFNYHFGAKLVRGAYMESERALAQKHGYPDPIHETLDDTHECYNRAVDMLLEHAASTSSKKNTEVMLATHNRESIEKAIASMNKHGIDRRATTIAFGQLYGMADNLSFNLGKHGYRAYKYVPYGEVKMVMPYLIRRATENSSVSKGARAELSLLFAELRRRRFGLASA